MDTDVAFTFSVKYDLNYFVTMQSLLWLHLFVMKEKQNGRCHAGGLLTPQLCLNETGS